MNLKPFDPLRHSSARDIPRHLLVAVWSLARGRFRFAGRLFSLSWRILLLSLGLIALSGCATRYVQTPCLTPSQVEEQRKAEPPKISEKLTGRADEDIKPIAGSAIELRAWGRGMLGILEGCSG